MKNLNEIVRFCDEYLNIQNIKDYDRAYNGLQVENNGTVTKIGSAVDANLLTIEQSVQQKVDLLIVHHGLFWGKSLPITGNVYKKYKLLHDNNIAVYSAHLPLDMHDEIGNNNLISKSLQLTVDKKIIVDKKLNFEIPLCSTNTNMEIITQKIKNLFPYAKLLNFGPTQLNKVAICSGGGSSIIPEIIQYGADTIVTGEVQQHVFGIAYENKINLYICGHYATEVFGVKNLSEIISNKFNIPKIFIPESCNL